MVELEAYRCQKCNRLLFYGAIVKGLVQIKCLRCDTISLLEFKPETAESKAY